MCTNSCILHPKQIHSDWFFWIFKKKYINISIDYYKGKKKEIKILCIEFFADEIKLQNFTYLYFWWWNIGAVGSGNIAAEFGTALSGNGNLSTVRGEGGWVNWASEEKSSKTFTSDTCILNRSTTWFMCTFFFLFLFSSKEWLKIDCWFLQKTIYFSRGSLSVSSLYR